MVLGGRAFGKCLNYKRGALMKDMIASWKRLPQRSLTPFSMWGYKEKSTTQKGALTRTQPHWHPDLGLPTSRILRNKFLNFCYLYPPSLWYFVIIACMELRHVPWRLLGLLGPINKGVYAHEFFQLSASVQATRWISFRDQGFSLNKWLSSHCPGKSHMRSPLSTMATSPGAGELEGMA